MHRRGRFFRFLLGGLIIFSLFGAMRGGSFRSGYARGFYEGQAATQQQPESAIPESGAVDGATQGGQTAVPNNNSFRTAPVYGHGNGIGHHHHGFFGFLGGIFKFFFTLMLIGFFFKMMAFGFWRRRAFSNGWKGPKGPHGRHYRWHRHGDDYEKSPEDVDPDVRTL